MGLGSKTSRPTPNGLLLPPRLYLLLQLPKTASAAGRQAVKHMSRWRPLQVHGTAGAFSSGWIQGSQGLFSSSPCFLPSQTGFLQEEDPKALCMHELFSSNIYGEGRFFSLKIFGQNS